MLSKNERIEWVDYFKAIAIIVVVLGHATPIFNRYIYQFHVGAFFCISGFVSDLSVKRFDEICIDKFFTLFLPYTFFAVIGVVVIWGLNRIGILEYVSSVSDITSLGEMLKTIFSYLRCDWLGASWFLLALLGGIIIQKFFLMICGNRMGIIYLLLSIGLFVMGYFWIKNGQCPFKIGNFVLYSIVQFYYALGIIIKAISLELKKKILKNIGISVRLVIVMLNILLFWVFGNVIEVNMDISQLKINNPILDFIMVLNGVIFLWNLSNILAWIKNKRIKNVLSLIGKNTLGILFFHFIGFKVCTLLLVCLRKTTLDNVALLCPPLDISKVFWPIYLIVSITVSMIVWCSLKKIKLINSLMGADKKIYKNIFLKINKSYFYGNFANYCENVICTLKGSYVEIWNIWKHDKKGGVLLGACLILIIIYIVV